MTPPQWSPPTHIQVLIKKMPSQTCLQTNLMDFLKCAFFLPDGSRLCQADHKLTNTDTKAESLALLFSSLSLVLENTCRCKCSCANWRRKRTKGRKGGMEEKKEGDGEFCSLRPFNPFSLPPHSFSNSVPQLESLCLTLLLAHALPILTHSSPTTAS